jgi:5'-methylthioadenosine phosphorylase
VTNDQAYQRYLHRMSNERVWPPLVTIPESERVDVGVFGGSGFYEFGTNTREVVLDTPYGAPTDAITISTIGDRRVAFLARHGRNHTSPAHAVNYRANIWALHSLGARALIAPFSCGSLRAELKPGEMVIVDDLVDRTNSRADTYFDGSDGVTNHIMFANPYDAALRSLALDACRKEGVKVHDGGTVVVINGPRFSTKAESRWFSQMGWSVVNMTQYPETVLAAEIGLPIVGVALVTDYDAGMEGIHERPVTMEEVFAVMRANMGRVRGVINRLVTTLPV